MKPGRAKTVSGWIVTGCAGFIVGYLVFDPSAELQRLRCSLANAESEILELRRSQADQPARPLSLPWPREPREAQSQSVTNPSPPRITKEDVETALVMNKRASKGEYILEFERPPDRKLMEDGIKAFAAEMASNNLPELREQFARLGLDSERAQQLEKHLEKIMLASLEAEQAIRQVLLAKGDYDKRMRSVLSGDAYAQYRHYEDAKPALREQAALAAYAAQQGTALDPAWEQQVAALIQQAGAYTQISWHGPYDGLPQITVGQEMVAAQLEQETAKLGQAAGEITRMAAEAGMPEALVNLLAAYYTHSVQQKRETIARILNPAPPVRRAR